MASSPSQRSTLRDNHNTFAALSDHTNAFAALGMTPKEGSSIDLSLLFNESSEAGVLHLFAMRSLLSIASAVGKPIAIDKATQLKSRPSTAKVKVILDLMNKHPKRVRIQSLDTISGKIIEVF